eukprot:TRINITY_DN11049_c0_g2_i3.p1 TRINITY_DN11049_c0_g2~~TRINITY_DN11049_c0_g2_i3.p1  ORF type:complete len:900 (+),score=270.31 TRINITY_DN11049_c0_g2_i3:31-2700(+)
MAKPDSKLSIAHDARSKCCWSGYQIEKGEPRITVYDRNDWSGGWTRKFLKASNWKRRYDVKSPEDVKHWKLMRAEDVESLSDGLIKMTAAEKKHSTAIWELKDEFMAAKVKAQVFEDICDLNDLPVIDKRPDFQLHMVVDGILHGRLPACPVCKTRGLIFYGQEYECCSNVSAATRCTHKGSQSLTREPFVLPDSLRKTKVFKDLKLKKHCTFEGDSGAGTTMDESADVAQSTEDVAQGQELAGLVFGVQGKFSTTKKVLEAEITEHGGTLSTDVLQMSAFISSETSIAKPPKLLKEALKEKLAVLNEDYIHHLCNREGPGIALRDLSKAKAYLLAGKLPSKRTASSTSSSGKRTASQANAEPKKRQPIKKGSPLLEVDQFGPEGTIYVDDNNLAHNVKLIATDLKTGTNKFYIIQMIKLASGKRYAVFYRWGQVGDNSGVMAGGWSYYGGGKDSFKQENYGSVAAALKGFGKKFKDKTGNNWAQVDSFKARPGKYTMVELAGQDDDDDDDVSAKAAPKNKKAKKSGHKSQLAPPLADFIRLITDSKMMQNALAQAHIDLKKMPLGNVSHHQITTAYAILKEIVDVLDGHTAVVDDNHRDVLLLDASNRFYTTIPHVFPSYGAPPVIGTKEELKRKLDLIEQLLNVTEANKLLKDTDDDDQHKLDASYQRLKCNLTPLAHDGDEFAMVQKYLTQTHAKTHSGYTLELQELFRAERHGEDARFKPYANLHNRKLLWHGSRLSNWTGILSQGLRIAPPEAPVTGYMFDKGVYFASMSSKSANYVFASRDSPVGVMLLCEVALGDMYERLQSEYTAAASTKKAGKHSCWGIGKTTPDPKETVTLEDGVEVPLGKGVNNPKAKGGALLYDEHIVYTTDQIKMRYVLKVKFNFH